MRKTALLGLLVLLALAFRGYALDRPLLWIDEAESAINALTILDHGVPVDHHLGLPLFENTLVRPWPESAEYEFRDLSYSDRGLAVYHSWLPLYTIAAALRLAGVTPEAARRGTPPTDASEEELARWTIVPRLPSLVFSAIFVLLCFRLGQQVYGADAGWSMALGAAVSGTLVWLGRQARYYSATLAFNAACGLTIWNACRRGHFRDHGLVGLMLGLLFHTHALSAVIMGIVYGAGILASWRQPRLASKVAVAGTVSGLLVLPWAWWTGFFDQLAQIPPARELLDFTALVDSLPSSDPVVLATAGLGVSWFLVTAALGRRLSERWRGPVAGQWRAFGFALAWLVAAYACFVLLIPAASYWDRRLQMTVAVPGLLLVALVLAALARTAFPGRSQWAATAAMAVFLLLSGQVRSPVPGPEVKSDEEEVYRLVRSWNLAPGARVLALPNHHLSLTYYTGVPIQSVSALRRDWLERFEGDLVIVEYSRYQGLLPETAEALARRMGHTLSEEAAEARVEELRWLVPALELRGVVEEVCPPPRALDDLDRSLVAAVHEETRGAMRAFALGTPLRRAAELADWREFWLYFFYWFSDPETRLGPGLNYGGRVRQCRADVLQSGWVVYDCRAKRHPPLVESIGC